MWWQRSECYAHPIERIRRCLFAIKEEIIPKTLKICQILEKSDWIWTCDQGAFVIYILNQKHLEDRLIPSRIFCRNGTNIRSTYRLACANNFHPVFNAQVTLRLLAKRTGIPALRTQMQISRGRVRPYEALRWNRCGTTVSLLVPPLLQKWRLRDQK